MSVSDNLRMALEGLMDAIQKQKDCLPYLNRIEDLAQKSELDPQLSHFLERRSYEKALTYLRNEVPARGSCGK